MEVDDDLEEEKYWFQLLNDLGSAAGDTYKTEETEEDSEGEADETSTDKREEETEDVSQLEEQLESNEVEVKIPLVSFEGFNSTGSVPESLGEYNNNIRDDSSVQKCSASGQYQINQKQSRDALPTRGEVMSQTSEVPQVNKAAPSSTISLSEMGIDPSIRQMLREYSPSDSNVWMDRNRGTHQSCEKTNGLPLDHRNDKKQTANKVQHEFVFYDDEKFEEELIRSATEVADKSVTSRSSHSNNTGFSDNAFGVNTDLYSTFRQSFAATNTTEKEIGKAINTERDVAPSNTKKSSEIADLAAKRIPSSQYYSGQLNPFDISSSKKFLISYLFGGSSLLPSRVSSYLQDTLLLSSFLGCAAESAVLLLENSRTIAEQYLTIYGRQATNPQQQHLERIKNSNSWEHIILRYSMASLTWQQRQLIAETKHDLSQNTAQAINASESVSGVRLEIKDAEDSFSFDEELKTVKSYEDKVLHASDAAWNRFRRDRLSEAASDYSFLLSTADFFGRFMPFPNNRSDVETGSQGEETTMDNTICSDSNTNEIFIEMNIHNWLVKHAIDGDQDAQYALARFFTAPPFHNKSHCEDCGVSFGMKSYRHHCRACGKTICSAHSQARRQIFRYGFVTPVRVCEQCKKNIDEVHSKDQLIWKAFRLQAYFENRLILYFDPEETTATKICTVDHSLTSTAYSVIKNSLVFLPPSKALIETACILQRYGLAGFASLLQKKDLVQSIESLRAHPVLSGVCGNRHELTASMYYQMAVNRAIAGSDIESPRKRHQFLCQVSSQEPGPAEDSVRSEATLSYTIDATVDTAKLSDAIRLAPLALRAVYENEAHLCQRVAQSLSWTLLYTSGRDSLQQLIVDFPHYALFISPTSEEAVLSIRSTGRINVILDELTNSTVEFPPSFPEIIAALHPSGATSIGQQQLQYGASPAYTFDDDNIAYLKESVPKMRPVNVESINQLDDDCSNDWELVNQNDTLSTYATSAVVRAAMQLLREVGPSLVTLVKKGLSIKVIGHSLGGSIAALIVSMLSNLTQTEESADSSSFNVFDGKISGCAYGSPCCMDLETSKQLKACGFTSIVLQDDVTARLSISTIKELAEEIALFRDNILRSSDQRWTAILKRSSQFYEDRRRDSSVSSKQRPVYVPGDVIHIYEYKGKYYGAEVPNDFEEFNRIKLSSAMFENHQGDKIFEALIEARQSCQKQQVDEEWDKEDCDMKWIPFDHASSCMCCKENFHWHSTYRGEISGYRERYNCYSCGNVVCGDCSKTKQAIPLRKIIFPRRICSRCQMSASYA